MKKTRVMIVDDQYISRQLFALYIQASEKYELVRQVESASLADAFVLKEPIDLILMDILMNDGSNGLDAAEKIKKKRPNIKIIAVTSMPESSWINRAKSIGIDSFWYKEVSKETIIEIMDRTMAGESVYPDTIPVVQIGNIRSSEFTDREIEVLRVMIKGISNAEIAKELGITENTVKQHIKHMMEKTGCKSRTELAIEARISGIVVNIN
ncbi:response regulator transcription factor [Eubacterium sp.]